MVYLVLIHVLLGVLLKYFPVAITLFYVLAFVWMGFDVIRTSDKDSRAGFYALYLMGFEVVYRMGKFVLAYEMGKYVSILILVAGLIFGTRKRFPYLFLILLLILLPSMFLTTGADFSSIRKDILFNMSGPLSLVISGMYFYQRPFDMEKLYKGFKIAFLPAFTLLVGLSLKSSLSSLEFESLNSNAKASGGFGANQVSTVIGWFILLIGLCKIQGRKITPFGWLDYVMLSMLILRGLLTFSRGGMMAAVFTFLVSFFFYLFISAEFRKKMTRLFPYVMAGLILVGVTIVYANKLTNNYLMYRYLGYSTNEMLRGQKDKDSSMLTGRDEIMKGDVAAFKENPLFGVGYGMAAKWHARFFGEAAAAHTEYSRLLSENGFLGIVYMLVVFIFLPVQYFTHAPNNLSRFFFLGFFLIGALTMFHAAMRVAFPGIILGASFLYIYSVIPSKSALVDDLASQ